jgi:hypothetical protein
VVLPFRFFSLKIDKPDREVRLYAVIDLPS